MKNYALIGRRLGHSFSQRYFESLFRRLGLSDHRYTLVEMETLEGLREWVSRDGINGFNVTIPFKQTVIGLLDSLDAEAEAIGAVNCVVVEGGGRLVGHNTDCGAFRRSLRDLPSVRQALVLGTGGAARAVGYALKTAGIPLRYVSRTPEGHPMPWGDTVPYSLVASSELSPATLVVNATPVGMFPDVDSSPWPNAALFRTDSVVYDLVYNPSPTLLMRQAAQHGATVTDGSRMLHLQADMSWRLWQGLE